MFKKVVFAFGVYLYSFQVAAQTDEIENVLLEVEKNNKELQAFSSMIDSRKLALKSGNNLSDPLAEVFYLPFGEHPGGDYTEFQVTQVFEFPTVYSTRNKLIDEQNVQMELEYRLRRQDVLLSARKKCIELITLNKRKIVEQTRIQQARIVFEQTQELFDLEQVSILDLNKAKISWMQVQFNIEQIDVARNNLLLHLKQLNGDNEVAFNQPVFIENLEIASSDSIWNRKQLLDPSLRILNQQEEIRLQQIKLSKNNALPDLIAGFNYQGVSGLNYSGVYGGVTIPLWNSKNKVKAAESSYIYQQSHSMDESTAAFVDFQKQYNHYQILLSKFQEYQNTLSGLNSDVLLFEAYEIGEVSFLEYYLELQFYHRAIDTMFDLENQLHQLIADIQKHQL